MGVVFLFAKIAPKLQLRIEEIRCAYPDCIAYQQVGDREKRVRIEFEYRSSNFRLHRHDASQCDWIVCWHHDWATTPDRLRVIELKKYFGVPFKVWIQVAIKSQWDVLDRTRRLTWALSPRVTYGDLLLMYRGYPSCSITDLFRFTDIRLHRGSAGWREGEANFGSIERLCRLDSPVFLSDLRNHRVLRTSSFVRKNMQGRGLLVSEYWSYLFAMIRERNPRHERLLARFSPDKLVS